MRSLKVCPVLSRRPCGRVAELLPSGYRLDLVHNKRERMLRVRRLIIMDRTETPVTDAALAAHCTQSRSVLAPQRAVGISWVAHMLQHCLSVPVDVAALDLQQPCPQPCWILSRERLVPDPLPYETVRGGGSFVPRAK